MHIEESNKYFFFAFAYFLLVMQELRGKLLKIKNVIRDCEEKKGQRCLFKILSYINTINFKIYTPFIDVCLNPVETYFSL